MSRERNRVSRLIPPLVKHVTMAIYAKKPALSHAPGPWVPQGVGPEEELFMACFQMAINTLTRQGFLSSGSSAAPDGRIFLTGKGQARSRTHSYDNFASSTQFIDLYIRAYGPKERRDPPGEPDELMGQSRIGKESISAVSPRASRKQDRVEKSLERGSKNRVAKARRAKSPRAKKAPRG